MNLRILQSSKGFSYEALELDSVDEITDAVQSGRADLAVIGSLSRQTDLRIVDMLGTAPFILSQTKAMMRFWKVSMMP